MAPNYVRPPFDRRNGAILIDLENFRIGWQEHYRSVLRYLDLCTVINELQSRFEFEAIFIGIYATKVDDIRARFHAQAHHAKSRMGKSHPPAVRHDAEREHFSVTQQAKIYERLIKGIQADEEKTEELTLVDFENRPFVRDIPRWCSRFDRLGGVGPESRECIVALQQFALKGHQGRKVQRGCDAAIVYNLTICSSSPAVDSVWILSGDSDFVGTCQKMALDDVRTWSVLSFSRSLPMDTRAHVKSITLPPRGHIGPFVKPGRVNFFDVERAIPAVCPEHLLSVGKRIPFYENKIDRHHPPDASCLAATEDAWRVLEQSKKYSLRSLEDFIYESIPGGKVTPDIMTNTKPKNPSQSPYEGPDVTAGNDGSWQNKVLEARLATLHCSEINLSDEENSLSPRSKSHSFKDQSEPSTLPTPTSSRLDSRSSSSDGSFSLTLLSEDISPQVKEKKVIEADDTTEATSTESTLLPTRNLDDPLLKPIHSAIDHSHLKRPLKSSKSSMSRRTKSPRKISLADDTTIKLPHRREVSTVDTNKMDSWGILTMGPGDGNSSVTRLDALTLHYGEVSSLFTPKIDLANHIPLVVDIDDDAPQQPVLALPSTSVKPIKPITSKLAKTEEMGRTAADEDVIIDLS